MVLAEEAAPPPPEAGTVPDPLRDFLKSGKWQPVIDTRQRLFDTFKQKRGSQ